MKINRGDSQDKGSQSRQAYHAAPAPAPKRPVQPDPDPQDLYEDAEGPDEYAEDDDDEPVRRRFPIGLVVLVVILAIVGIGGWKVFQFYGEVAGNGELGPEQTVTIEQGSTVADITNVLKEDGVIQYDWLFKLYAKYSGRASGLQYGDFTLRSGMDYNTILKTLSVQQVKRKTITITFPEGYTAVAIAQKMEENGLCSVDDFLACANGEDGSDFSQYDFWNAIPDTEGRLMKCEGYLFPDTYEFFTDDSVYNYVNTFYKEFDAKTSDLWDTINEKGTTMNDVVILASFIQEEAGMPAEDAKVSACFHITGQDGFDTNDCIKDVRTCISFKRSESVYIEYIVFCCLVGEVSVFDRSHSDHLRCCFCLFFRYGTVLCDLFIHLFCDLADQVLKTHNAAFSCLKRLAVFSVHGTKTKEGKLGLRFYKTGLSCAAEDLDKMKLLTFVNNVKDLIRLEQLHTLYNCGKVCSSIKRCPV